MPRKAVNIENLKNRPIGRPKGVKNKIPTEIKARVLHVWERLQGNKVTSLLAIARDDPRWFYEIFGRLLLPKAVEVSGKDGDPIQHAHIVGIMDTKALDDAISRIRDK